MKQYILDRHTTPGTPVMDQVPTEKIPVYDDQAAAEADLANLAVGQIVGTKDVGISSDIVEALKQYISDENELSDYEKITISTDSNNPTLIPYDGFITVYNTVDTSAFRFYINGVGITNEGASYNAPRGHTLALKKGDLVYETGVNQDTSCYFLIAYYKKRHYGYRQ